jgi:hypothetical protein
MLTFPEYITIICEVNKFRSIDGSEWIIARPEKSSRHSTEILGAGGRLISSNPCISSKRVDYLKPCINAQLFIFSKNAGALSV